MKEIFTSWSYKGNKLAPPLDIARRLLAYPFLQVLRGLLFVVIAVGWGMEEAKLITKDLA